MLLLLLLLLLLLVVVVVVVVLLVLLLLFLVVVAHSLTPQTAHRPTAPPDPSIHPPVPRVCLFSTPRCPVVAPLHPPTHPSAP